MKNNLINKSWLILCGLLFYASILAQSSDANIYRNGIYASFFEGVTQIGINYEGFFAHKGRYFLAASAGLGSYEELSLVNFEGSSSASYLTLPHRITANWGSQNHQLEGGLGGTVAMNSNSTLYSAYFTLGYRGARRYPHRFYWRIFSNLYFVSTNQFDASPVGVTLGWRL